MTPIAKRLILAAALVGGLATSAEAGPTNTLYIGDLGGHTVLRYDATTITNPTPINGPGNPWVSGFSPEGITAGVNGLPGPNSSVLFVVNDSNGTIETLNANANTNPVINPDFITVGGTPGNIVAGIAVSSNGHDLYVAAQSLNEVIEYNTVTGAQIASVSLPGAHDVVVGPDGSVYASGFGDNDGVVKFSANLTSPTQFIAPSANGLDHASGMVFDSAGNLWVSNTDLSTPANSMVQEYSSTGTHLMTVSGSPLFNPLGLTLGPDGNIYVANLGDLSTGAGSAVLEINDTTGTLSTYIPSSGSGLDPKYVYFSSEFVTYAVPEPSSAILFLTGLGIGGIALAARNGKRGRREA